MCSESNYLTVSQYQVLWTLWILLVFIVLWFSITGVLSPLYGISGSNAGYTMFRGSVKGTGYPLHSPVSPSLPLLCVTVCYHISAGVYLHSSTSSVAITKRNADKRNARTPCSGFELVTTPWASELRTCVIVPAVRPSVKGNAIPLRAWTDPEGSRRLRLPDYKTIGTWRW